jgi:hypothetical protein
MALAALALYAASLIALLASRKPTRAGESMQSNPS